MFDFIKSRTKKQWVVFVIWLFILFTVVTMDVQNGKPLAAITFVLVQVIVFSGACVLFHRYNTKHFDNWPHDENK